MLDILHLDKLTESSVSHVPFRAGFKCKQFKKISAFLFWVYLNTHLHSVATTQLALVHTVLDTLLPSLRRQGACEN